ncbi:MAG: hypothetical protein J1F03_06800 [Oscillospiraceae bacterium]|nr:hypothetical protein [Oscillospiraceae bacterium]
MADYVKFFNTDKYVDVCFYIEDEKPFAVGEKMNVICEEAEMSGYNWEALLNYYLKNNAPELLDGMKTDPEAGMYAAYYDLSPENEKKAEKFAELITRLVENEEELYSLVRDHGDEIEWD